MKTNLVMERNPFINQPKAENTRAIPGAVFHFLVRSDQTEGDYSLIEIFVRRGAEPPAHTHTHEDETYYVLEGEVKYEIAGQPYHACKGDVVFLPRGMKHGFKVVSEQAHVLMLLSPGHLDQWFWDNSAPHQGNEIPAVPAGPPPAEVIEHFVQSLAACGVVMA